MKVSYPLTIEHLSNKQHKFNKVRDVKYVAKRWTWHK